MPLNILTIGASRNIGYFASVRLLDAGANITFLLRSPTIFDNDDVIQNYVAAGKAHLLKGDALIKDDVQRAWDEARKFGNVDFLLFTVGGAPKMSLTKGAVITPHNLVTQALLNALSTVPQSQQAPEVQPRVIAISSIGLTKSSHSALPLPLKPLYGWLLKIPHADKMGTERVMAHAAGWSWDAQNNGEPAEDIMGPNWKERLGEALPAGSLKRALVIRPAMLMDGECVADRVGRKGAPYRVSEGDIRSWTISRKDVGHFVFDVIQNRWDEFEDKVISIGY